MSLLLHFHILHLHPFLGIHLLLLLHCRHFILFFHRRRHLILLLLNIECLHKRSTSFSFCSFFCSSASFSSSSLALSSQSFILFLRFLLTLSHLFLTFILFLTSLFFHREKPGKYFWGGFKFWWFHKRFPIFRHSYFS